MWGVFAKMERNIIFQRVKSGMKNAVAKGKQIGRPETTKDNLTDTFGKYYQMYNAGNINIFRYCSYYELFPGICLQVFKNGGGGLTPISNDIKY